MIVTITGPTCSGKSTLEKLLKQHGMVNAISHTTRPMRVGEENGREYFFVSNEEFDSMHQEGKFVETVKFCGNQYGMSAEQIQSKLADRKIVVIVVEPHGQHQIKQYALKRNIPCVSVFLNTSIRLITERFLKRFKGDLTESSSKDELVAKYAERLAGIIESELYWMNGNFKYRLIINNFDESSQDDAVRYILTEVKVAAQTFKRDKLPHC